MWISREELLNECGEIGKKGWGFFFSFMNTFCILQNFIWAILTEQGYRVLVVEQTETPEQLELRRKEKGSKDKVCWFIYLRILGFLGLSFLAIKYSFTFSKNWLLNKDSRYTFTFVTFMLTKILFADHYVTSSSQIHKSNLEIATYYLGNSFFAIISSDSHVKFGT